MKKAMVLGIMLSVFFILAPVLTQAQDVWVQDGSGKQHYGSVGRDKIIDIYEDGRHYWGDVDRGGFVTIYNKHDSGVHSGHEDYVPNQGAQWVPSGKGHINTQTGEYLPDVGGSNAEPPKKKPDTREGPCSTSVKDAMDRARTRH